MGPRPGKHIVRGGKQVNGYERALRTLRFEETDRVATWGGWIVSAGFFEYVTGKGTSPVLPHRA